jgi:hypothetical protein
MIYLFSSKNLKRRMTNMYTGTIFNWHDNSAFDVGTDVVDATNRPLFMVVNAFDKGPEKIMEVDATNFNTLFGTMSYEKYGQGSIQAQNIINAGGRLLVKRVCANDATLAYSVLVAHLASNEISWSLEEVALNSGSVKKFSDIKAAAIDQWDKTSSDDPAERTIPVFIIADNGRGLSSKAFSISPDYDTSRGIGEMLYRFNIYEGTTLIENANISLNPEFTFNDDYYGLDRTRMVQVIGEVIPEMYEKFLFEICKIVFDQGSDYVPSETEKNYVIHNVDFINATTLYGDEKVYKMVYDATTKSVTLYTDSSNPDGVIIYKYKKDSNGVKQGIILDTPYGNVFRNQGDNGVYGNTPARYGNNTNIITKLGSTYDTLMKTEIDQITDPDKKAHVQYVRDIASVYLGYDTDGSPIDEVWDVDAHKIFAVADANYDKLIKDCIANFVEFRQDCIFLRDCGIGATDVASAISIYSKRSSNIGENSTFILENRMRNVSEFNDYKFNVTAINDIFNIKDAEIRSRFIADYGTTYEIIDPISKRNITVTMLYDLVAKLTSLYINKGPFAPLAGTYNGFQLEAAIPETVNFIPIITPLLNQKEAIDDVRLNYAIFEDTDSCVVQSNYTSQKANTQLSYINNVLAIQEVARVVRTVCPRNRFRLITGSDMSDYATAVNRVLAGYNTYFETLEFMYTEDKLRSVQKIFYASINFSFNNWAQTEIFDLYALSSTTQNSVNS